MTSRLLASAVLALGLAAGANAGLAQSSPGLNLGEGCVLAAAPSSESVCEQRMLTFAFDGVRAVDPMDMSAPHTMMIGSTAMLPFLTTDESTLVASRPLDPDLDPETTGSISGSHEMKR
jgi:hypothetical protein